MFPRKFKNDQKQELTSHHSITFTTDLSEKKLVASLIEKGVADFISFDNPYVTGTWGAKDFKGKKPYKDNRITGEPSIRTNVGCNSHMKNQNLNTLFPIHKKQLENLGYTEENIIEWINFLNGMRVGLKFYYLGEQAAPKMVETEWRNKCLVDSNDYYWVFLPSHSEDGHWKRVYLQWVALRYLINTTTSSVSMNGLKLKLGYFNIPRITMMLHEDFKISKIKAFLYAQLANPFYSYWGMNYSDSINPLNHFDVSVKATEMKKLLTEKNVSVSMNMMLCIGNTSPAVEKILGRKLKATYEISKLFFLFQKGEYANFVKEIKKCYRLEKKTTTRRKLAVK